MKSLAFSKDFIIFAPQNAVKCRVMTFVQYMPMRRSCLILLTILAFCLLYPAGAAAASQFVIVIDPGHGGGDIGTPKRKQKLNEKDISLKVALKLGELIKTNCPDVKIVYTRDTDVYPTLPERTRIAREAKGNLFVSIHVNAALDSSARGLETYIFGITGLAGKSEAEQKRIRERTMIERENLDIDGNQIDFENAVDLETKILCQTQREKHNRYSQEVAHYVQDNIMSGLRRSSYRNFALDRGVKQKNIFVLCYSPMPAILVELGYMSNSIEEKFLNTTEAHDLFARCIFKGCEQYYNNWKRRQLKADEIASPYMPEPATPDPVVYEEPKTDNTVADDVKAEEQKSSNTPTAEPARPQPKDSGKGQPAAEIVDVKDAIPAVPAEACYRIQFLNSPKPLKKGDPRLKGLTQIHYYKSNGSYRYTTAKGDSRSDLSLDMQNVKKLFPDAFIIQFDANGERVK